MLLRRDATFLDKVTYRSERVFPPGTDWMTFRSQLPAAEVFANSVLDPAIGIGGELGLAAFATADWRNWTSSIKIGLFELSTRVGLPALKDQSLNQGLSLVFNTLDTTANAFANSDNPAEIVPELVTNVGFQVVVQVLQMVGASNPVTFVVTAVIQIATWAVSIARNTIESDLGKNLSFPPLQSEDPATDTWQVTRVFEVFRSRGVGGVVFPDGEIEAASNANYTSLYLPAYRTNRAPTTRGGRRVQCKPRGSDRKEGNHPRRVRPSLHRRLRARKPREAELDRRQRRDPSQLPDPRVRRQALDKLRQEDVQLRQEDVQLLKGRMSKLSNKTVNNALTVLNTLLKCAVEWEVIRESPVKIRLLKVTQGRVQFYDFDFDDFERLVEGARKTDPRALLVVLLGGEAGLRRGEIMALEWTRVDFNQSASADDRPSRVEGSRRVAQGQQDPHGADDHAIDRGPASAPAPAGGACAVPGRREHGHGEGDPKVALRRPASRHAARQRTPHAASHLLLAPGDARGASACDPRTRWPRQPDDDPALHAPVAGRVGPRDQGTRAAAASPAASPNEPKSSAP
jgi:hypothetical protein